MDLEATKALALSLMLLLSLAAGLLPLKVYSFIMSLPQHLSQIVLSACLCFGAGILFSTVFLHLMPETKATLEEASSLGFIKDFNYPLSELIVCLGFFLIYAIEELVHFWIHSMEHRKHQGRRCRKSSERCDSLTQVAVVAGCEAHCRPDTISGSISSTSPIGTAVDAHEESIEDDNEMVPRYLKKVSTVRSLMIVLALSFHGAFEGLAIGLEESNRDVWLLSGAVTTHKIFIAFSIGIELIENAIPKLVYILYMIVFSFASPIGGTIGSVLMSTSGTETKAGMITTFVLQGISGGTILYVTFCEVLERERAKSHGRFAKLLSFACGFALMSALETLEGHSHEKMPSP